MVILIVRLNIFVYYCSNYRSLISYREGSDDLSKSIGMEIMSDEEFFEMKDREEKERFFDSLISASGSSTKKMGFSVKSMKKQEDNKKAESKQPEKRQTKGRSIFRRSEHEDGEFDDNRWNSLLDKIEELHNSPIDDVTDQEIHDFGRKALESLSGRDVEDDDPTSRYEKMFKKEIAMYAEILKDVNAQTRIVATKLKTLSAGKGQYGVSKYFSDMLEQYNSLNNTKITAVSKMADLKAKSEDFRLKSIKSEVEEERTVDELVDQYYGSVMNGGRAEFMNRSLLSQSAHESDREVYDSVTSGTYEYPEGQKIAKASWNITQPIPSNIGGVDTGVVADKHGYIKNEKRKPEICIQRFEDGNLAFIALDEDGLAVDDYELPGDDLLESINIKPMSNFAYDKYGRKYSIIDVSTSGVDLSDLDDDDYQYGDD